MKCQKTLRWTILFMTLAALFAVVGCSSGPEPGSDTARFPVPTEIVPAISTPPPTSTPIPVPSPEPPRLQRQRQPTQRQRRRPTHRPNLPRLQPPRGRRLAGFRPQTSPCPRRAGAPSRSPPFWRTARALCSCSTGASSEVSARTSSESWPRRTPSSWSVTLS